MIEPGEIGRATDFINESEADGTPANDAGRVVKLESDGKMSPFFLRPPVRTVLSAPATRGSSSTRFDITRPGGNTSRYTWDGVGTDPVINATTFPIGMRVQIISSDFVVGNNYDGLVTGSGANYFEVTNTAGSAENDQTLDVGGSLTIQQTWTKPANLRYIELELVGAGASGDNARKGGDSVFKTIVAGGGVSTGSVATGGDLNIPGRWGESSTTSDIPGGRGGDSLLGMGGKGISNAGGTNGGQGGGGGGYSPSNSSGGGSPGGCSGAYAKKIILASALSASEIYFIGKGGLGVSGGANNTSGGSGGDGIIVITAHF